MFDKLTIEEAKDWLPCFPEGWEFRRPKSERQGHEGVGFSSCEYKFSYRMNGKSYRCPGFDVWQTILKRCRTGSLPSAMNYSSVEVCEDWIHFESFARWYYPQRLDFVRASTQGRFDVDKDILAAAYDLTASYNPKTCLLVPHKLNCVLSTHAGQIPGVRHRSGVGFTASFEGKPVGKFETLAEAQHAWKVKRWNSIKTMELPKFWSENLQAKVRKGLRAIFVKKFGEVNA